MSQIPVLQAASIINPHTEGHYAFFSFPEQISTQPHQHDFFEIFLIVTGSILHHINGESRLLREGQVVFIRPDDIHFYQPNGGDNCELINLAFLRHTFDALRDYLQLAEKEMSLLTSPLSVTLWLTPSEKMQLTERLKQLGHLMFQDIPRSRLTLRALLAQVISSYFIARTEDFLPGTPQWLIEVCQRMRQKEHVTEGRAALIRLANCTPEHLTRTFKTYLRLTPSHYINNLRLEYASHLLLNTDESITEICFEVGFENLSYFYRVFRERWQQTPQQFRRMNRRISIPL